MATIVKNEDDLNTISDDLITEDYALEVLGLKNVADFRKFSRSFMKLSKIVKGIEDGKANSSHTHDNPDIISLDASKLKGTIDIARLPASALERCVVVADDTARFKLTKSQVQNGDSVKVTSPDNLMYIVVDDNKLNSADGYVAYSAAVKWETIKDKPDTFPPSSHTHDDRYYTESETDTKLAEKANTNHTHNYAPVSHTHDDRYYTESEIDTKFKNFCPFPVNSLYLSLGSENPSTLWLGTTWAKQEGRFLLGSSGSYALGSTGGASTVKLAVANLPSHTHSATTAAHTHTQPAHTHSSQKSYGPKVEWQVMQAYYAGNRSELGAAGIATTASGGDTTGSASPVTSIGATGSGTDFSIMPPYLVVNIWKRLS